MKKARGFFCVVMILMLCVGLWGSTSVAATSDKDAIIGEWTIKYFFEDGDIKDVSDVADSIMTFYDDGTMEISLNGDEYEGTWTWIDTSDDMVAYHVKTGDLSLFMGVMTDTDQLLFNMDETSWIYDRKSHYASAPSGGSRSDNKDIDLCDEKDWKYYSENKDFPTFDSYCSFAEFTEQEEKSYKYDCGTDEDTGFALIDSYVENVVKNNGYEVLDLSGAIKGSKTYSISKNDEQVAYVVGGMNEDRFVLIFAFFD